MSNSAKLSETISKNKIASSSSMSQEEKVKTAAEHAIMILESKYPNIRFENRKILTKKEINRKLRRENRKYAKYQSSDKSDIRPDSGLVGMYVDKEWKIIFVAEAKKQGTNKERMEKGHDRQAKGNAIERAPKNFNEIRNYMKSEKIFPFIVFASGCDFHDGSTISDRLTSINCACEINKLHIRKLKERSGNLEAVGSLFIREKEWTIPEIRKVLLEAAEISIKHYLK